MLLVLLLTAMACATVFESTNGSQQALAAFYGSAWFEGLLCLVAVNVSAAVLARYPFARRQAGFVVTHAAIVLTFGGGLITARYEVDGQIGIAEGQTVDQLNLLSRDALTIANTADGSSATIDLDSPVFRRFRAVENPPTPPLGLADMRVDVLRYLPDTAWSRRVSEADDPTLMPAIELALSAPAGNSRTWVFADHRPVTIGPTPVSFRVVSDPAKLAELLSEPAAGRPATETRIAFARFPGFSHKSKAIAEVDLTFSGEVVSATCRGETFDLPLEQCLEGPVPLGDTGYTVRVLRYLPHAQVGPHNRLSNASSQPVNPAIEVEITGPTTATTTATTTDDDAHPPKPTAPLEIVSGPDGRMYARFERAGTISPPRELQLGVAVDTPWQGHSLTVLRRVEHARVDWELASRPAVRPDAEPGILVRLGTPEHAEEVWVQRHQPERVRVGGTPYELIYSAKQLPLGFELTLNSFRVRTYPGSERPRSYESRITIEDPASGDTRNHLVSMNRPVTIGGYTLYQSSFRPSSGGPAVSYLGVSRDPGKPVVFAGYVLLMIGMLMVIWTRIAKPRATAAAGNQPSVAPGDAPRSGC